MSALALPEASTAAPACHDIEADPEWTAITKLGGSRVRDELLCAHRHDCCKIEERLTTQPPSARRVVKLGLRQRHEGACDPRDSPTTEYWLLETRADGNAATPRLLAAAHYAPYAPERGVLEGTDTFVWYTQETCYGRTDGSCVPGEWRRWRLLALSPSPHVVDEGERTCATSVPFMVSVDF